MKTRCLGNLRNLEIGINVKYCNLKKCNLFSCNYHTQKKYRQGDFSETWLYLSVLQIFDNSHST